MKIQGPITIHFIDEQGRNRVMLYDSVTFDTGTNLMHAVSINQHYQGRGESEDEALVNLLLVKVKEKQRLEQAGRENLNSIAALNKKLNEYETTIEKLKEDLADAEDIRLCPHNDEVIEETKTELEQLKLNIRLLNEIHNAKKPDQDKIDQMLGDIR